MTLTGFLANLATLIVLKKNISIFSRVIRLLLINQSLIDSIACLFAAILILQARYVHCRTILRIDICGDGFLYDKYNFFNDNKLYSLFCAILE